jgi:hypothetical protein
MFGNNDKVGMCKTIQVPHPNGAGILAVFKFGLNKNC